MKNFTDYETKSDFEINLMFLKSIRHTCGFYQDHRILKKAHAGDGRSVGVEQNDNYYWYDFCNNYNDAMGFLERAGVTLVPLQDDGRWMGLTKFEGKNVTRYSGYHTKMLRAGIQALLAKEGS